MDIGTYTILLERETSGEIRFGAAGSRTLEAGAYAYTGSALGPGGLSRVKRHRAVYEGENETRHWHIDYLLGDPETGWVNVWTAPVATECAIAGSLPGEPVEGIGASDCSCSSHLQYSPNRRLLADAIARRYQSLSPD